MIYFFDFACIICGAHNVHSKMCVFERDISSVHANSLTKDAMELKLEICGLQSMSVSFKVI